MTLILTICTFALAMSISPGPVNIITLSSGANHGFWRTLPFVSGATIGFTALLFFLGIGAVELIQLYPTAMKAIGYLGTTFILYMAFKIFTSHGTLSIEDIKTPKFHEGALLQWLNPKAWIACVSGITAFTTKGEFSSLALFCGLFFIMCYVSIAFWAVLGSKAQHFLRTNKQQRTFNTVMSTGLTLVAVYLFMV